MNIGIIGKGFVGSAIKEGLKDYYNILTYDLDKNKCNSTQKEVCKNAEIIFVCVPTPMRIDGSCDTRILESAIKDLDKACVEMGRIATRPIVVIKSTVPPGTTERIGKQYISRENEEPDMHICFSPEFLTEANSFKDFKNQTRIIIGGEGAKKVKQMFRKPFPNIPIVITQSSTAEMVKYFTNCFLASKVTFANQMYDICQSADIDYDKVCEYVLYDARIGKSHLAVPGPDGDRGFGGHCFPKDLAAMINFAFENNVPYSATFLQEVESYNNLVRTNKDWEKMKGRAVSDD